jgi:hypothetical protein
MNEPDRGRVGVVVVRGAFDGSVATESGAGIGFSTFGDSLDTCSSGGVDTCPKAWTGVTRGVSTSRSSARGGSEDKDFFGYVSYQ